ncbi:hypothetical protein SAMN05444147_10668 [Pectobacterium carotovorum]|nr:hypothetical protein SAMN05444147_10668 [Pectobacterium carotovorum]
MQDPNAMRLELEGLSEAMPKFYLCMTQDFGTGSTRMISDLEQFHRGIHVYLIFRED